MKHRLKGLLALVLSLVMVFALATNAWATVRIGNEFLSDNGASISDGTNGTATLNISTENGVEVYTLTLNNFTMVDNSHYEAISSDQDLTLNLIGGNEITASYGSGAVAVSVTGKLAIEGTGSLTASGTKDGIAANGNLTITDATVTATGGDYCDGIYAGENITITNATVTATGDEAGIYSKKTITITGGKVTAEGDTDGLSASNVNIEGGTVTATGDEDCGIYTEDGNVTISGGTVKATGEKYGIFADKGTNSGGMKVTISGGSVEAYADDGGDGIGIYAPSGEIAISGTNTEVTVGCVTGLEANTVNILENSTVTITTNATAPAVGKAIDATTLNFGGNWYQWSENGGPVNISSNTNQLTVDAAKGIQTLTIGKIVQVSTYTVKFDANGGSGTMADATGVSGNYTLPANGFNAPVGDVFFGWSVDPAGAEQKHPGETMQITKDTTVYAIWKYATLGNQGGGYPGTPQPPSIYIPTVEEKPIESPKTFDGGIASAVVVTILSATGGAWLAKKKD